MLKNCINKVFTKKNVFYILLFVSIFFAFQDISFAADTAGTKSMEAKTIEFLNMILQIFGSILGAVTAFVSIFLHPGWYNGQIFDLNIYLKDIWVLMSNVVYFVFAFILIYIAFMNIIGRGGEKYQLKTALPRFIVGVLIVPFTWFIVQFVLSISAILTVSVLALPFSTFEQYNFMDELGKKTICTQYEIPLGNPSEDKKATKTDATGKTPTESIKCVQIGDKPKVGDIVKGVITPAEGKTSDSIYGLVSIYTYGVIGIDGFDELKIKDIGSGVTTITKITLKVIFDIIFIIVYCLLMLALFMALFTRGIWLWIYSMLSPLFGLLYFFSGGAPEHMKKFKFSEFFALAMVPVYVSAALSFGLVFLMVASNGMSKQASSSSEGGDTGSKIIECQEGYVLDEGSKAPECKINVGDFSFKITGALGNTDNIFAGSMGALGVLIIQMFGIVILWLAVMTALNQSSITKAIISPIEHFGQSVGGTVMKLPQYAPILPGGMSAKGLETIGKMPGSALETGVATSVGKYQQPINRLFGGDSVDIGVKANIQKALDDGIKGDSELQEIQSKLSGLVSKHGTQHSEVRELVKLLGTKLKDYNLGKDLDPEKLFDSAGRITADGYAILHGNLNDSRGQYTGTYQSEKYAEKALNPSGVSNNDKKTVIPKPEVYANNQYKYLNTIIEISPDKKGFNDKGDYVELASKLVSSNPSGVSKNSLIDAIKEMGITDEKNINDVLKELQSHIRKDGDNFKFDQGRGLNGDSFFK